MSLSGSNSIYASAVSEINGVTGTDAAAPPNSAFIQFQAYRAVAIGNGTGSNAAGAASVRHSRLRPISAIMPWAPLT